MTSRAFCPGHITALFYAPEPGPTPGSTGSRGAGVCISAGAVARVSVKRGGYSTVVPKGNTRLSPVMVAALSEYMLRSAEPMALHVDLDLGLPVGQGFGMSGAMTFAALVATEAQLGLVDGDADTLLAHAHAAEVGFSTGLGDVVAQARGGIDLRVREGIPPDGEVLCRHQDGELLIAWSDQPLPTRTVLSGVITRERLMRACRPRLEGLDGVPDIDWLLDQGWAFSREAGLVDEAVSRMVEVCSRHGRASQVMLGNSVFASGDLVAMAADLGEEGFHSATVQVDNQGVRVLR